MKRVASLYLPYWSIDRLRRAERAHAPRPEAGPAALSQENWDSLAAAATAKQVERPVPDTPGWRPGARWAREDGPARDARTAAATAPSSAEIETAILALPAHQRPSFQELSRRSEVTGSPFRPLRPDDGCQSAGMTTRPASDAMRAGGEAASGTPPSPRRGSRAGHGGETGHLPPPARLVAVPSVRHRDRHGVTGRTPGIVTRAGPGQVEAPAPAPLVIVHRTGARVEIAAACPAALALGLAPGTALAQARAQVPGLDVRPADPAGDRADLARLALVLARRWTPVVAPSGEDGLLLDLSGVAHLHGGEARFARRLVRLLAHRGVSARIAVADTAGAAWAMARFGAAAPVAQEPLRPKPSPADDGVRNGGRPVARARGGPQPGGNGRGTPGWSHATADTGAGATGGRIAIVPPGAHVAALAPLPVAALRVDGSDRDLLARLGVDRIGQLLAMPRAPLVRRFGRSLVKRLDQATGAAPEPLDPVVPRETVAVAQRFAEPIATAEAIAHWLAVLVPRLADELAAAGLGARAVEMVAERVDGVAQRLQLGFARPVRNPAHLLRLALRRIEEIDPGFGIDSIALVVRRADPLGPEPLGARLAEETSPDLAPLVDALANRIGPGRLWRAAALESDVPERSVGTLPPLDPPPGSTAPLAPGDVRLLDERDRDHPWHPRWPRPALLLRRPEPVEHVLAGLPDRAPARFTWRGEVHLVVRADGPERIAGEWWRRAGERQAIRDYFHVEDAAGARFWLYRRGDGVRAATGDLTWFLHGRFG